MHDLPLTRAFTYAFFIGRLLVGGYNDNLVRVWDTLKVKDMKWLVADLSAAILNSWSFIALSLTVLFCFVLVCFFLSFWPTFPCASISWSDLLFYIQFCFPLSYPIIPYSVLSWSILPALSCPALSCTILLYYSQSFPPMSWYPRLSYHVFLFWFCFHLLTQAGYMGS